MSEKMQHTAASTREKMLNRYNDGLEHKHNKNRHPYRQHWRSHPANQSDIIDQDAELTASTGMVREFNLRKIKKNSKKTG